MKFAAIVATPLLAASLLAAGPAMAATWTMDRAHSKLGFSGSQSGTPFSGQFKTFDAAIVFDPAKPATAHVTVTVDMSSATTGDPQKDGALPGADWFDITEFPRATFEATRFVPKGGNAFEAPGTLTIRGIVKPVTLAFTLTVAGNTAHAAGQVPLVRTAFGVGQGNWTSGDTVALDVGVDFDIAATAGP